MSFQTYLDNIKAKTGESSEGFQTDAGKVDLLAAGVKATQIVSWLKKEYGLGYAHAMGLQR